MLKIAIVGTGIIGLSHIDAIKQIKECELVCLCDVKEEVVKPLAEENNVPYVLDYKEIPGKIDCDAVILNLPHGLHCESTVFFLDNGINVFIEKPMANTTEECEIMIEAAKRNGKKLAVAHPQRYFNAIAKMKEIYDSGELGKFCMYSGCRSINYFADSRPRWFLSKKLAGGVILMNFCAQQLDKIQYITGERVTEVYSSTANYKNDFDIEGHAQVFGKLSGGASFSLAFSGYTPCEYYDLFYFTNGCMKSNGSSTIDVLRNGRWERLEGIATDGKEMVRELTEFVKFIKGEEANIPDAEFGRDVIATIEKIYANNI
ncbi:MAG: Gfo/Idh/MocA family oxidoreductase [Clostridia bacterium]|nr:Gfo/Idh/MocA family oxidoreductase [Clostridia bacterium]